MSELLGVNYASIAEPLREIPVAICNRIDSERRYELEGKHPALPMITKWTVQVAGRTFEGAEALAAESKTDPDRRYRTAVCIPPLARAVLDNLFSLIFLYDAPTENAQWFVERVWCEACQEQALLLERHQADPQYAKWLSEYGLFVDRLAKDAAVSQEHQKDPKTIRPWPLPSQMIYGKSRGGVATTKDPGRRSFMKHLHSWYYGSLSSDAHSTGLGLARRSSLLFDGIDPKTLPLRLSQKFFQMLTVYVALLSEVVGELKFLHESFRLRQVWKHIMPWPEAEDLLSARYDEWLPGTVVSPL